VQIVQIKELINNIINDLRNIRSKYISVIAKISFQTELVTDSKTVTIKFSVKCVQVAILELMDDWYLFYKKNDQ